MASLVPAPASIRAFASAAAFESWLSANHDKKSEVFLRIYKKQSGRATVTHSEALDVALCWGWIDGIRKAYDEQSFLQRFTPRRAKSGWSQINKGHVERLIAEGRMKPPGLAQIKAAQADGRWHAAYAPATKMTVPQDLVAALKAEPKAWATFQTLNRQNLFALAYRLGNLKTAAGRAKRIAAFVEMLKQGKSPHPSQAAARASQKAARQGGR